MRNSIYILLFFFAYWASAVAQKPRTEAEMLVFPLQTQHVHGSSIVELPGTNGDLLTAWFQGSGERNADDVRIMGSRFSQGQWSAPFVLADTPHLPDCNPVLFMNANNRLFLVWIAVQANRWEHSVLRLLSTSDYLQQGTPRWTWQDNIFLKPGDDFAVEVAKGLQALPPTGHGWAEYAPPYDRAILSAAKDPAKRSFGWMTRIKPLVRSDGRIVLPLYSDGFNLSMMALSEDHGKTWLPGKPLVGRGPIQPALALRKDGQLVAFLRDSGDAPNRAQYSESNDLGKSWTPAIKTDIPSAASVEALVLQDGRWILIVNDDGKGRARLSLYVSEDEGRSWKEKFLLEDQQEGGYSYPAVIQSADGSIHITYSYHPGKDRKSIKYIKINPKHLRL